MYVYAPQGGDFKPTSILTLLWQKKKRTHIYLNKEKAKDKPSCSKQKIWWSIEQKARNMNTSEQVNERKLPTK